ncbi:MAG: hypothetical protein WCA35_28910, partial [Kovacikia sp.]
VRSDRADNPVFPKTPTSNPNRVASKNFQQSHQTYAGGEVPPMSEFSDEETESLKAQADRINQLLAELEATIRQGGAIVDPHQTYLPNEMAPETTPFDFSSPEPQVSHYSPGATSSFNRHDRVPLDRNLKRKVQEAAETAQALRHLANRERAVPPKGLYEDLAKPRSHRPGSHPIRQLGLQIRQFLQVPQKPMDQLGDAVLWIVLSAVVRLGARFLISSYPVFGPIVTVLMFAPPALAVYLAVFVPKAGFVSVYRLFLITLGLLLGGKL